MFTLLLMRHGDAPSVWPQPDEQRQVTLDGLAAVTQAGKQLFGTGLAPQAVICSDVLRTRQTWEALQKGWPAKTSASAPAPQVWLERRVYSAGPRELAEIITESAHIVPTDGPLLVIGHAPTIPQLIWHYAAPAEREENPAVTGQYPAGAVTGLRFPAAASSAELDPESAEIVMWLPPFSY